MAEFLTTNGVSHTLETIITSAKKRLVLVSPYLKFSRTFIERISVLSEKNVLIQIIYGKDAVIGVDDRLFIDSLENLELYYLDNLHAKCYFNENLMVITSMNLYDFSEKNNREFGVFIRKTNDKILYQNAVDEIESIIYVSETLKLSTSTIQERYNNLASKESSGGEACCIRCKKVIRFNPSKPLCYECFGIWDEFQNYNFIENYCHSCSKPSSVSFGRPQCIRCYESWIKKMNSL